MTQTQPETLTEYLLRVRPETEADMEAALTAVAIDMTAAQALRRDARAMDDQRVELVRRRASPGDRPRQPRPGLPAPRPGAPGGGGVTKLLITYHMHSGYTVEDETAIVLPLTEQNAAELMAHQRRSRLISGPGYSKGLLATTLDRLAKLQGYGYAEFICAEHIDRF